MFEKRECSEESLLFEKKREIDPSMQSNIPRNISRNISRKLDMNRIGCCDKLESDASPAFFFPIIHSETEILSVTLHTLSTFNLYVLTTEHENISSPLIISLETGKEERGTKDALYSIFFIYHFFTISKTLLFIETISPEDFSYYFPFSPTFL